MRDRDERANARAVMHHGRTQSRRLRWVVVISVSRGYTNMCIACTELGRYSRDHGPTANRQRRSCIFHVSSHLAAARSHVSTLSSSLPSYQISALRVRLPSPNSNANTHHTARMPKLAGYAPCPCACACTSVPTPRTSCPLPTSPRHPSKGALGARDAHGHEAP